MFTLIVKNIVLYILIGNNLCRGLIDVFLIMEMYSGKVLTVIKNSLVTGLWSEILYPGWHL